MSDQPKMTDSTWFVASKNAMSRGGGFLDHLTRPTVYTLLLSAVVSILAIYLHLTGVLHVELHTEMLGPAVEGARELLELLAIIYAAIVGFRGFANKLSGGDG